MNIYNSLRDEIVKIVKEIYDFHDVEHIVVETPKDSSNGDLSSNVAMVMASRLKQKPKDIALKLKEALLSLPYITAIDIAGPGFLNFKVDVSFWRENLAVILKEGEKYGISNIGHTKKVNIEYVSANPTGPMHIGHARGAVYGDALANLLKTTGFDVTKEYYINDAGSQIDNLLKTALLRYREQVLDENIDIPEGLYPGEYMIPVAKKLHEEFGKDLLEKDEQESLKLIRNIVLDEMMQIIKRDLEEIGIKHDVFFSETDLVASGSIPKSIKILEEKGLIFKGTLPPPKGKEQENWIAKEQLLFRSTAYGDEQDRPIQKVDGSWTYFASDIAYANDKIARNFDSVIMILGADHAGYAKRIEGVFDALSNGRMQTEIKLCQLVNYLENGDPVKMSKRSGTFTTVDDVIKEVGKDIIRFIMLTRKNDMGLDFDLQKVKEQSKDNPVFYVNYAHVRSRSILNNAKDTCLKAYEKFQAKSANTSLLAQEEEIELMKMLALWPKVLEGAAIHFEPHRVAFYLQNLAGFFHSLWNLGKEKNNYRFISPSDSELTAARLMLVDAVRIVISSGLKIIGVDAMEKM